MSELVGDHNPRNVAGGYKATLNNDNASDEAKQRARENLKEIEESGLLEQGNGGAPRTSNVVGGHKANLKNPNTSEESKEHSKQVLAENDVESSA